MRLLYRQRAAPRPPWEGLPVEGLVHLGEEASTVADPHPETRNFDRRGIQARVWTCRFADAPHDAGL